MTIPEIRAICRAVWGATNSNRIQSAMGVAISYLEPVMRISTTRWVVPMLYDLAVYAGQYGDDDCAGWLEEAADALCEHITDKGG